MVEYLEGEQLSACCTQGMLSSLFEVEGSSGTRHRVRQLRMKRQGRVRLGVAKFCRFNTKNAKRFRPIVWLFRYAPLCPTIDDGPARKGEIKRVSILCE
jgi:hypothetical protein